MEGEPGFITPCGNGVVNIVSLLNMIWVTRGIFTARISNRSLPRAASECRFSDRRERSHCTLLTDRAVSSQRGNLLLIHNFFNPF